MHANSEKLQNVRTTILSLLVARKKGCTLRQLDNDYFEVEGTHIPWKDLGYISLLSFLHSMSKNVEIHHQNNTIIVKGIASDKSKHVSKLVAGQKDQTNPIGRKSYKPSHYYPKTAPPKVHIPADILLKIISLVDDHPDGVNKDYVLQEVQSHMPFINITMQDMEEQFKELQHKIFISNDKIFPIQSQFKHSDHLNKTNDMSSLVLASKSFNELERKSPIITVGGDEDFDDVSNDDEEDDFKFTFTSNLCDKKTTINSKSTSNFIKESVFKLQDQVIESTSVANFKQNNSYYLHDYDINNDDQFHMEFNSNAKEKTKEYSDNNNGEILINERVKFRLETLIQNHPNGIWCAELPEIYLEEYRVSLNYTELGFNSVREFASQLPEIFHCVQPHGTGDFMLYYAKGEIPSIEDKLNHKTSNIAQLHQIYEPDNDEALPVTVSLDVCKELIPDDTMTIGECVGYINVSDLIENEKPYIEVIVVEVFTPSFFWIQLRKKQKAFKSFMNDIHHFYTMKHEQYVIPPLVLEKGLNCACMYNNVWHRGIIKTVKPDLQVTVMFYDYGTLKTYPPEEIHYLHRMFSYLPAQAIPCGLVNTRPYKGSKWTRSATHHFALRTQIPLIATIASVNTEDNSMMVTLTDTSEEEDVHINDWLVEQKLAEHGKMGDKVEMNNMLLYVEENLLFSPERCYESETSVPDKHSTELTKKSVNVPLILPQSTLDDTYFKTSSEFTLSEKSPNLVSVAEENTQNQSSPNNSISTTDTSIKNCTNPFLQETPVCDEVDLSPKKLMQLWSENLQLQMQITTTLNILFNKILKDSTCSEYNNLRKNENISDTLLYVNDVLSTNSADKSISNTCQGNTSNVNTCTENFNMNIYHDFFQNANTQNVISNDNLTYADGLTSSNNIFKAKIRPPPGYEKYNNQFKLNQHYLRNDRNTNLITSNNSLNNNTDLRETNPFKLSLAGKMKISDLQDNCSTSDYWAPTLPENRNLISQYDSIVQRFIDKKGSKMQTSTQEISGNTCKNTIFNHSQSFFANDLNDINNTKNESFILNTKSPLPSGYNSNLDNVTNTMSRIMINNQQINHAVQKIKEMEKNTEQHLYSVSEIDTPVCITEETNDFKSGSRFLSLIENPTKFDDQFIHNSTFITSKDIFSCKDANKKLTSNYDLNKSELFTKISNNNLESFPTFVSNINSDEGYFTRPSTSHSSSPLLQLSNETECSERLLTKNLNKSAEVINSFQNAAQLSNWNKAILQPVKCEQTAMYSQNQWYHNVKNSDVENVTKSSTTVDNTGTLNVCLMENPLKNIIKHTSSDHVIFFQALELPSGIVHICYYQGEGWLLTEEFIEKFTKFESTSYALIFLYTLNISVQYKQIDGTDCSVKFINVGSTMSRTTENIMKNKNNIHLIPLNSMIEILDRLKVISKEDVNNVLKNDPLIQDIWAINSAYRELLHCIENAE